MPRSGTLLAAVVAEPGEDGELASAVPAPTTPPVTASVIDARTAAARRLSRVVIDGFSREMGAAH
jgi:hypothetical protein